VIVNVVTLTPAAVEGPLLLNVTVLVTVLPAFALAGTLTVVVTSAIGVMAVEPLAVCVGCIGFSRVVPIVVLTATGPAAGAV